MKKKSFFDAQTEFRIYKSKSLNTRGTYALFCHKRTNNKVYTVYLLANSDSHLQNF